MRVIAARPMPLDAPSGGPLLLRDGTVAAVRVAGPADIDAVRHFFHRMRPEARYQRFFCAGEPPSEVIARFCAPADPRRSVTLLALRTVNTNERLIAVASYVRVNDTVAEAAFAVDDDFEDCGMATALLERLAGLARQAGFERFQATTLFDNARMMEVFRDSGFTIRSKPGAGCIEVELSLIPSRDTVAACEQREHQATAASIRPLLHPGAVAVVGTSRDRSSLGRRLFDAIVAAGYEGPLYAVNAHADDIDGRKAHRSVRELPAGVDLAVIVVPRDSVFDVVDDCAAAGVKSLVVITAGFAEAGSEGLALQQRLLAKVRGYGMRMVGPNCMGLVNTHLGLNASFSPTFPPAGRVALSSQSGALGIALLSLAAERGVGLSAFVSVGNKADVSSNDLLQYWEDDPSTAVILLYLESFGNPRCFARLARRIGRVKPIVAVKAGRTRAGSRAAGSHIAALSASEAAVDSLFCQTGVIRADTIDEMFDVAACLEAQPLPPGRRVAIVTNAGGPGILAADACEAAGLAVAEFSEATRARLAEFLPAVASLRNPVDMVVSAGPDEYRRCIEVALAAADVDSLVVIYAPVDSGRSSAILGAIREGIVAGRQAGATAKPVLACLMADSGRPVPLDPFGRLRVDAERRQGVDANDERVPAYRFPENAVRALGKVATYANWRAQPPGLFWSFNDIHADEARTLCRQIVDARGDDWLTPEELRRVMSAFGLPFVPGVLAQNAEDAVAIASVIGLPVVMKLSSHQLVHKSEVGGVRLNLSTPQAVRRAFNELAATARQGGFGDVQGVLVQPMVVDAVEMIVGITEDPQFGPLVGVGRGGTHVEAVGDVHFRLAPLTDRDVEEQLHEMRGRRVLEGFRGRPRADVEALAEVVLRVSRLAEDIPDIIELDLSPVMVLAAGQGCRIVDARIKVGRRPPV